MPTRATSRQETSAITGSKASSSLRCRANTGFAAERSTARSVPPEADGGSRLWGVNYEVTLREDSTIGVTYLKLFANRTRPSRDGLNVFNARAFVSPIPALPDLSFELELATEANGLLRHSNAWTLRAGYALSGVVWTPDISYRYARFEGNKPGSLRNEAFDPLFPGFVDWGTWWQGEIAGEYFLSNSNLASRQIRVRAAPSERIETGLLLYGFALDQPATYGPGVTSSRLGFEADWFLDWTINRTVSLSVVGAFANPGEAVRQALDRTANLSYAMAYLTYSY
jgi:Alginate export